MLEGKTYIIIRLSSLGDVAMTLPALYEAAEEHPEDNFVLLTQSFMARLAIDAPINFRVMIFSKDKDGSLPGLANFLRQVHTLYPSAVIIDLQDAYYTKALRTGLKLLGHTVHKIKCPRKERRRLVLRQKTPKVPDALYLERMTDLYVATLEDAGISMLGKGRIVAVGDSCNTRVTIGLAPYAQYQGKMISEEQTLWLIDALTALYPDGDIILYGAPGTEARKNRALVQQRPDRVRLTTAQGLAGEVREIARLDCMISMDSANQHIAAMVGTPVVSMWGATHPAGGYVPFRSPMSNCIGVEMPCRPCSVHGEKICERGDYACIQRMPLQTVLDRVAAEVAHKRGKVNRPSTPRE
ncbi:MAG: glycosyltransferase family 9 protein [Porphyromonas sp.]|nr:glycosyltransferase family 9 protein [Porphyromonas sp.]